MVPAEVSGGLEDDFASPCVEDVCFSSLVYKYHYIHTYTLLLRFQCVIM